jgi:predicted DNA-binding protein
MPQPRARYQQELFEEPAVPAIRLPLEVQQQLRQALAQWMRALAKIIREDDDHE